MPVTVFEDRAAIVRAGETTSRRPDDRKVDISPNHVEYFQAFEF